ncbi:MAG: helix-turn-helix transcriptional regulator [archaeon]|nr:helix-turn-helix transcriptional regulator [archaeon]
MYNNKKLEGFYPLPDADKVNFYKALRHSLEQTGKRQADLAEEVGVKQPHINRLLKGFSFGSDKVRNDIANVFGYSYKDFLKMGEKQKQIPSNMIFSNKKTKKMPPLNSLNENFYRICDKLNDRIPLINAHADLVAINEEEKKDFLHAIYVWLLAEGYQPP